MKKIIVCTLAVFTVYIAFGHNLSDSVEVYFNIGQWRFSPALGDNSASIDSFIERIRVAADSHNLDHIVIRSYASPDGSLSVNRRLSEERCDAIADLIVSRTGISSEFIRKMPEGVAWSKLRRLVEDSHEVPFRSEILNILDNPPLWIYDSKGRIIDGRKKRLMLLDGGMPYRWMLYHLFPKLRSALTVSVYLKPDSCEQSAMANTAESFHSADRIDFVSSVTPDTLQRSVIYEPLDMDVVPLPISVENTSVSSVEPRYRFALKTNLPYYAILMPNLELEWLINDRWSMAIEGNVAWYKFSYNKTYQLSIIASEVRRWIKPRAPWHDVYVGLFAGGGWYDLGSGATGYRGEGMMTGVSLGYMWPIRKNLSFDAGAGAGYVYTRFKEYKIYEGCHLYQRTKLLNYFGPLKLKFSIVWRFCDANKSKRKRIKSEI